MMSASAFAFYASKLVKLTPALQEKSFCENIFKRGQNILFASAVTVKIKKVNFANFKQRDLVETGTFQTQNLHSVFFTITVKCEMSF